MEPEIGQPAVDLAGRLLAEPHRFSFFQMVRLLERAHPEAIPLGHQGPAAREVLRLRPSLSFAFPNSDVSALTREAGGEGHPRYTVEVNFLGLYGSVSPLPSFFTEEMLQAPDETELVRGFLDLFHHRFLSLFFRIWLKYRHYENYLPEGTDAFTSLLFALAGFGIVRPPGGGAVPPVALLKYTGQLTRKSCSPSALAAVLRDYFDDLQVKVTSCAERWVSITEQNRNRLGQANARLGIDLQAGERVYDRSGRFRVTLGPLGLDEFISFLPGKEQTKALDALVRLVVTDDLEHELELTLAHDAVPPLELGGSLAGLGWTTWLGSPKQDAAVVFPPATA